MSFIIKIIVVTDFLEDHPTSFPQLKRSFARESVRNLTCIAKLPIDVSQIVITSDFSACAC